MRTQRESLSMSLLSVAMGLWGLLSTAGSDASVLFGPILNPANHHTYLLLETAPWTDSEAEALTLGGHLVTINDSAENDWVFDTFVPLLPTTVGAFIWIGLNDAAHEGTLEWASGEPVTFTNWSSGQPDNAHSGEDYAHLWTPDIIPQAPEVWRQWNDLPNELAGANGYGVVEVVPIPASVWLFGSGLAGLLAFKRRLVSGQFGEPQRVAA